MKKVFLSPSDQWNNLYAWGNTREQVMCEKYASACEKALKRSGIDVLMAVNDLDDWDEGHINPSNRFKPDLHVAIHTNAYKGNCGGVQVYYGSIGATNARTMFNELKAIFPTTFNSSAEGINGSKVNSWSEFYDVVAPVLYLEINFHDVEEIAKWMVEHVELIGETIAKGICKVLGVAYVPVGSSTQTVEKPVETPVINSFELKAGTVLELKNEPLYVASTSKTHVSTVIGKYYVWSNIPVNGKIRITNTASRVGINGQVTGWINMPSGSTITYIVVKGDTLSKIANKYNTTVGAIAKLNYIEDINLIHVGQKLKIPV